jgi:hypothetical protein
MIGILTFGLLASSAFAAPRIDSVSIKSGAKSPEVEITVAVTRGGANCDMRVDFGDGEGRTIDFGLATIRTLKHAYRKGGSFKVAVRGTGKTPCEGVREAAVSVAGPAAKKVAEKKKAAKKKSAAKKKDEKS